MDVRVLKPGIDRFAFESQDRKDAFMHATERLSCNKAFQRFYAEGEFSKRQGTFGGQPPGTKSIEICGSGILGTVDNAQVFAAATFYRWLG
jgi:hypothetical protein